MADSVTKSISAENTFSDPIRVDKGEFDLSISGTFVATVTVQRCRTSAGTYLDIEEHTAPAEKYGKCSGSWYYRAGVKTGDFTSGSVEIDLSI